MVVQNIKDVKFLNCSTSSKTMKLLILARRGYVMVSGDFLRSVGIKLAEPEEDDEDIYNPYDPYL